MSRSPGHHIRLPAIALALAALAAGPAASAPAAARQRAVGWRQQAMVRTDAIRGDLVQARAAADLVATSRAARRRLAPLALAPGDLLSVSSDKGDLLTVTIKGSRSRVTAVPLETEFVARGIDVTPGGLVAIAAISQVLLYDTVTGDLRIYTEPDGEGSSFGFAADVLFDDKGKLIIADMGGEPLEKSPTDGRIWQLDPATETFTRLASRRALSNPKLLALDSRGRVIFVDGEAGLPITPLATGRYDVVYRIKGARRLVAQPLFRDPGLQATAFHIDASDRYWFGAVGEIVLLEGKTLTYPCTVPPPFGFLTGLVGNDDDTVYAADGVDQLPGRWRIVEVSAVCESASRAQGARIDGARGLTRFDPAVN